MSPRVSVIIPVYNAGAYLAETVASVRAQTFADWEVVVADDASTDGTLALANSIAEGDPRIRVLSVPPPNGTAARTRNTAAAAARGEWLALLDGDDRWLPEKLARQMAHLEAHPDADAACCWYRHIGDPALVAHKDALQAPSNAPIVTKAETLRVCPFQTSTIVLRRSVYEALGGMDESELLRSVEDYEFFTRLVATYRVLRIPEVLSEYRLIETGASLSGTTLGDTNERGWNVYESLVAKGVLSGREARVKRAALYYEQAKDNLFHVHAPFRLPLFKSVMTGGAPAEAKLMFPLSILPAPLLRPTLKALQRWRSGR